MSWSEAARHAIALVLLLFAIAWGIGWMAGVAVVAFRLVTRLVP